MLQRTKATTRDARIDAELGVGRLPGADLDAGPLRDDASIPEPVSLRVVEDDPDAVSQIAPVALRRRVVARQRVAALVTCLLGVLAEPLELLWRVARRRPDRRVRDEEERDDDDGRSGDRNGRYPPLRERENDEPEDERAECRTCVRVQQRDVEEKCEQPPPPAERAAEDVDERDDERVRTRERRQERRNEPPDRIVFVGRVVDPVLRKAGQPLVLQPELLAIPTRHTRVAPRLQ